MDETNPSPAGSRRARQLELAGKLLLVAFYVLFTFSIALRFFKGPELSLAFLFIKEMLTLALAVMRKPALSVSPRFHEWLVALIGTGAGSFFRGHAGDIDHWPALLMQAGGMAIAIIGLVALNRSFGVVPANRGLKTSGLYRVLRHPVYFGYLVSYVGFCLNHPATMNWLVLAVLVISTVLRIVYEERHLRQSEDYHTFTTQTRWRLLPFVW